MKGSATSSGDSELEGVAPIAKDYWEISVTRLAESTTADKVKAHLQNKGIEVKEVFLLSSKIKGTKAAKVRVDVAHKERAKSPEFWPVHCRVSDWINFRKKTQQTGRTAAIERRES